MRPTCVLLLATLQHAAFAWTPDEVAARLAARAVIETGEDGDIDAEGRPRRQLPTEIQIHVTAPLFSSRLFRYGREAGDRLVPEQIDVGMQLDLMKPITFYDQQYSTIYILSNGGIGFDSASRTYRTDIFPNGKAMIAPFWNRNDLRKGGHVYYREVTDGRIIERGQSEIRYQYDKVVNVHSAILVTWENMQPLGNNKLPQENTNTFQAAIFNTDNGTYVNYIFNNIGWTQGAESGFNAGDAVNYHSLPTSGTGNIMYLEEYGNTGIPGEWMFQVDERRVIRCKVGVKGDTCDEQCGSNEWGYDCRECCHCASGSCDATNGHCRQGGCAQCWSNTPQCDVRDESCKVRGSGCAVNAISFTETDRCGEPIQRCQCLSGYEGDGHVECNDIDECAANDVCHPDANCVNTPGNFFCQCKEGFAGDGVNECLATFLYRYETHQSLPKNVPKAGWQLHRPMMIFGERRDKLLIGRNGIIALTDIPDGDGAQSLDEMHVVGFAPLYHSGDILRGNVYVEETDDAETLQRATELIATHFTDEPNFVAENVLIVTYVNVTKARDPRQQNTFQAVLIGGKSAVSNDLTFVEYLYSDIQWTDNAEAQIMAQQYEESYTLPGSHTDAVRALAQLSNVGSPGRWVFRVDKRSVDVCPRSNQQPPYCDETDFVVPAQVDSRGSEESSGEQPETTASTLTRTTTTTTAQRTATISAARTTTRTTNARNTTTPEHFTVPQGVTIRPSLVTSAHRPNLIIPNINVPVQSNGVPVRVGPVATLRPNIVSPPSPIVIVPDTRLPTSTQRTSIITSTFTEPTQHISTTTTQEQSPTTQRRPQTTTTQQEVVPPHNTVSRTGQPPPTTVQRQPSTTISRRPSPATTNRQPTLIHTATTTQEPVIENNQVDENTRPIFVLRTTTTPLPTRPPPRLVTSAPDIRDNSIGGVDPNRPIGPYGSGRSPPQNEDDSSKLAIIIPTVIVGAWLLLLLIIGLVVCCKRRRTRKSLRSKYDPTYHFRQVPAGGAYPAVIATRASIAPHSGAYEEHLEKAARLSTEMGQYKQPSRLSLYGSYWNLNGQQPAGRPDPYHSAYFNQSYYDSCPEFTGMAPGTRQSYAGYGSRY